MIKKIIELTGNMPLHIEIYNDEIIFRIFEIGIPIVLNRARKNIDYRTSYYEFMDEEIEGLNVHALREMVEVMDYLEANKEYILSNF